MSASTPGARDPAHRESDLVFLSVLLLFVLPFTLPMLRAPFTGDDLMNLYYHRFRLPPWRAFSDVPAFWTTYRRPLGGCLYLILYSLFGLGTPVPYYLAGFLLFIINVILLFFLFRRLTSNGYLSVLAAAIASVHWVMFNVWYNFGAVYELLAFTFMLTAFHLYRRALDVRGAAPFAGWYGAALLSYVLAISGKEMAVTLPGILLAYEVIYRAQRDRLSVQLPRMALRLTPFMLIAGVAVAAKALGAGAMWRDNPAYAYHVDSTIVDNLGRYLEMLCLDRIHCPGPAAIFVLAAALGLALWLRDRHMLFGWCYFLITLLPVLGLPRVWGLFLYIPLAGPGLYLASAAVHLGQAVRRVLTRAFPGYGAGAWPAWLALLLALATLTGIHRVPTSRAADVFCRPGIRKAAFRQQLTQAYPTMPSSSVLLFLHSPYDSWELHFGVWLSYAEPGIEVLGGPNFSLDSFRELVASGRIPHVFDYEDDELHELAADVLLKADGSGTRAARGGAP